jgi:hypothetical protein
VGFLPICTFSKPATPLSVPIYASEDSYLYSAPISNYLLSPPLPLCLHDNLRLLLSRKKNSSRLEIPSTINKGLNLWDRLCLQNGRTARFAVRHRIDSDFVRVSKLIIFSVTQLEKTLGLFLEISPLDQIYSAPNKSNYIYHLRSIWAIENDFRRRHNNS